LAGVFASPIIFPPQSFILAMGRDYDRVVLKDKEVQNVKYINASVSADHRFIDGA